MTVGLLQARGCPPLEACRSGLRCQHERLAAAPAGAQLTSASCFWPHKDQLQSSGAPHGSAKVCHLDLARSGSRWPMPTRQHFTRAETPGCRPALFCKQAAHLRRGLLIALARKHHWQRWLRLAEDLVKVVPNLVQLGAVQQRWRLRCRLATIGKPCESGCGQQVLLIR